MNVLDVKDLCKSYETFKLKDVSFSLQESKITGFIGRNGAGKTTTLKSLLNFVHPDSGEISFFGKNFTDNEFQIKQKIGFVSGGIDYYKSKKLKTITTITKSFYKEWNENAYLKYMQMFMLDENKTSSQLSTGMKIKYSLVLALSHNAKLLILDEPTSGLDPVSRDELLDVFMQLCRDGVTILFSTHITSDLDKCADNIIYIKNGKIIAESELDEFVNEYRIVELTEAQLTDKVKPYLIGCKISKNGYSAIIKKADIISVGIEVKKADLEDIMVHIEKEEE